MGVLEIILFLFALYLVLKGVMGLYFQEVTVGKRVILIEGTWALVASTAYLVFGIVLAGIVVFLALEELRFWIIFLVGGIIMAIIMMIASEEGVRKSG